MSTTQTTNPEAFLKAATLTEALPWIRRFQGAIFVVKLGGNAMVDDALLQAFADDMVFLHTVGVRPVVVHGGGPQISQALKDKGLIFVGIDIIGNYLTEINVTSPTGIREIKSYDSIAIEEMFWDFIEKKLAI